MFKNTAWNKILTHLVPLARCYTKRKHCFCSCWCCCASLPPTVPRLHFQNKTSNIKNIAKVTNNDKSLRNYLWMSKNEKDHLSEYNRPNKPFMIPQVVSGKISSSFGWKDLLKFDLCPNNMFSLKWTEGKQKNKGIKKQIKIKRGNKFMQRNDIEAYKHLVVILHMWQSGSRRQKQHNYMSV